VLVDGLHDRLVLAQVAQVLGEDVEVVAVGVERRDVPLGSLPTVVAVQKWVTWSSPSTRTSPRVIVVLPEPESPTMPSITGRGI